MPTLPVVTVHRLAPGLIREVWCRGMESLDLDACEVLKRDGESRVLRATIAGRDVVIKCQPRRGMVRGLRTWLGLSRDDRQWRGAALLIDAGIPTATPLALVTRTAPGGQPEGMLVLERLAGPTLLEVLARGGLSVKQEHALAREAGRIAGRVHLAGLSNRDAKPSNWIVTSTDPRHPGLAMIDTAGVRRGADPIGVLVSMVIEAIGTGCAPRRTLMMRCVLASIDATWTPGETLTRKDVRGVWRVVAEAVKAHGDPTPRVNPLGPPKPER